MANSTALITDLTTLTTNAFSALSITKSKVTDNVDLVGTASSALELASDLKEALQLLAANTDSTAPDPQRTLINNILGTLA